MKRLLTIILLTILASGCAHNRKMTYPGNFVYLEQKQISSEMTLDQKQITSEMALMSNYMRQIDEILSDAFTISSEQQARIANILSLIDASADSLGAGSVKTNHLIIDSHIDQFKTDVNVAIRNARSDPPNYFPLGKLAGSCAACHQYR